mmetsp:Transcript_5543/g.11405  ORF Transcript_5543/g.11405 Transcript_5543/m.11405 type:complete len:274 (+) Transcript_5543:1018-1839(+)
MSRVSVIKRQHLWCKDTTSQEVTSQSSLVNSCAARLTLMQMMTLHSRHHRAVFRPTRTQWTKLLLPRQLSTTNHTLTKWTWHIITVVLFIGLLLELRELQELQPPVGALHQQLGPPHEYLPGTRLHHLRCLSKAETRPVCVAAAPRSFLILPLSAKHQENRFLHLIFLLSNIHTALEHHLITTIINSSNSKLLDPMHTCSHTTNSSLLRTMTNPNAAMGQEATRQTRVQKQMTPNLKKWLYPSTRHLRRQRLARLRVLACAPRTLLGGTLMID